ncbi:MAG TPA: NAD(P)/FAD-dependent oxidoreductase [Kouleothrix sp.]|uniref:NAD(P)/FAD-dependent oxidoreductase n=1 Tax=Kouleothrix sp. TaxID=2779161 RepID=UPI002C48F00F|nr:NAD(P)/FAD-dependent oxidoreductase [Kouleothrix sp.]HRC76325.1 NAD(P)/FAD-dependent oxidoreductase [Kouleothrix sp.]
MHDLIIVGGGAAALSAAVYALGKQLDVVIVYEKLGGKAGTQQHLRGQPGDEYVAGAAAARALEQQVLAYPNATICDRVSSVVKNDGVFQVSTGQHGVLEGRSVLVATGAAPKPLEAPGALELLGQGLGYSATTHAHIVAGKPVAVVGTSVRALRGAAELARTAAKVYIIAPEAGGLETPLAHSLRQRTNVELIEGFQVKAVVGPFNVEALVIEQGDEHRRLRVNAAFVDLGLVPNSAIVQKIAQTDADGFIWVDELNATTLPGLFAAGDVTTAFGEQILIAIGDGARAALSAYDYILTHTPA